MSEPKFEPSDLRPTHQCFDDALDYLEHRVHQDPMLAFADRLLLVHGIALAPEGPRRDEPFAHAWVEDVDKVWQAGRVVGTGIRIFYPTPRDKFLAHFRVQKCTRYSVQEALHENYRTNHYGPWLDEYRELCARMRTLGEEK